MNRILPIQGAATARGDTRMAEANRSQQQRFEQAMQLDPEQKATDKHRANGQSREPLQQQLLQAQQQKKDLADKARQQDLAAAHVRSKKQQPASPIQEDQSGSFLADVAARDRKETAHQTDQHSQDIARETSAHRVPDAWSQPGREGAQGTPPSAQEDPPTCSDQGTDNTLIAGEISGLDRAQVTEQAAQPLNDAASVDARELAEQIASDADTDINEITLSDEMPEASGQPLPLPVKTPGDLLLARMAPTEAPRELGQLLERLAVDIYQELGRPERPPLLRLTLPQLGDLAIRIAHQGGELQIEILATAQGELLLNQGRSDLVDRLQRLYPGERVALDLFGQSDSEQGSRHKRSIYEEWDADA